MILRKTWKHKELGEQAAVGHLMEVLGVSRAVANLLVQRNIYSLDQAKAFFRPNINSMHDPYLMKDMAKAVDRVSEAIKQNEKILVYGDYDVDGTSAVALLYSFLSKLTTAIDFYIPNRYTEGYGVSYQGIDFAAEGDFKLIITLDCGIKACEKILYGKEKNIDFIICDHHHPGDTLPDAYAILNPKRKDCAYPDKELSGCGVGFKFIHALSKKLNIPFEDVKPYLDLVAISIAADIVPITGENRILAFHGLDRINKNPRPGIEAALRLGGVKRRPESLAKVEYNFSKYITISDLVFIVGPRINAAGRIDTGKNSVLLLLSETLEKSESLANLINDFNNERKSLDKQAFDDALQQIDNSEDLQKKKTTVLYNKDWNKGVVGIVASRLIEHYYKPTIVFTESNGLLTGSARSIKDFDLYQAIDACSHLIEHFGGHKFAAGLSIKPENFEAFCNEFERLANETLTSEMLVPEIEIDDELNFSEITPKFLRILKQFAPFGPGNMAPVFHTHNVYDTGYSRPIGENHLKLNVTQPDLKAAGFDAIAFGFGSSFEKIHDQRLPMKICYSIEENEWNGRVTTQLNVKDLVVSEENTAQEE